MLDDTDKYFGPGLPFVYPFHTYTRMLRIAADAPRVGPGCVLCTRIDPLRFLAGCRRRRLNQGLVVALGFFSRC